MMPPLRHLPLARLTSDAPDRELLDRYIRERDERAFAALVARHGRMVRSVCRRVLGHDADADDAAQATFLVLVRKASSIRDRNGLANWLFGVAHNVATKARQTRTRRQAKEAKTPPRPPEAVTSDFAELLHAELAKLPAAYRAVVVLCDLEGQTLAEAARQLGVPTGTVASRLARGRTQLANRLRSLGLSVSVGLIAALIGESANGAGVTFTLNEDLPGPVQLLANEVMQTMFTLSKTKLLAAVVGVLALVGMPTAVLTGAAPPREPIKAPVPKDKEKKEHPIIGSWEPIEDGGPEGGGRLVVTFQADGKVKYEHGKQVEWGWYKLDVAKDPAEIEYATPRRANSENNALPFLGIVKVEDDVLTLCLSEKVRPAKFKPTDGTAGILSSQYRRVKGEEKREQVSAQLPKADPALVDPTKSDDASQSRPQPPKGFAPFFTLGQALVEWDGDDKLKVRIQVPIGQFLKLTDAKGQAAHVYDFHTPEAGPQSVSLDDAEIYDVAGNKKAKDDWKKLLKGRTQVLYMPKQFHEPKSFRDQFKAFLKDDALILVVSDEVNKAFNPTKNLPKYESLPQAFPGQAPKPGDPAVPPPKPGGFDPGRR